jgi:hypothetical protein
MVPWNPELVDLLKRSLSLSHLVKTYLALAGKPWLLPYLTLRLCSFGT